MDLTQVVQLLSNNGLAIFLVVWYVFKQSKIDQQMSQTFQELTAAIKELTKEHQK